MAESMQDIKRRMRSIESTEHITNAMRLVSAAKDVYKRQHLFCSQDSYHFSRKQLAT